MTRAISLLWMTVMLWVIGGPHLLASGGTITGKVIADSVKDPHDTVVSIDKIEGKAFAPPTEHAKIDQINKEFVPHVLPILVGTTVDFHNSDEGAHDVFSPDNVVAPKLKFNPWLKGGFRSYTFTKPGVAALLCHIHTEMSAYVVVLETPYFAVTDAEGRYTISNVPPGTYRLSTWHEKFKAQEQAVSVPESGTVTVDLSLQ